MPRYPLLLIVFSVYGLHAQTSAGQVSDPVATGTPQATGVPATPTVPVTPTGTVVPAPPAEDKRAYGVLPNYRTAEASTPFQPLTAKQKMNIAFKDSFDGAVYPTAAIFSVIYQAENENPSFGQGLKGYAQRVGAAFGDQMIGNMMTEGIAPALFHQDPRYFRLAEGSKGKRIWYAATRIFVAPTDNDHMIFNFSEWGGNSVAVAISNLYYRDGRDVGDNVQKLLIQCGTDALSNVLKEFWPDVKRALSKKNKN